MFVPPPELFIKRVLRDPISFYNFLKSSHNWLMSSFMGPSSVLSAFLLIKSSKWARWSLSLLRSIFLRSFIIFSTFFSTSGYVWMNSHNFWTSLAVNWGEIEERSSLSPEYLFKRFLINVISESKTSWSTFFFFSLSISSLCSFIFSLFFFIFFLCLSC